MQEYTSLLAWVRASSDKWMADNDFTFDELYTQNSAQISSPIVRALEYLSHRIRKESLATYSGNVGVVMPKKIPNVKTKVDASVVAKVAMIIVALAEIIHDPDIVIVYAPANNLVSYLWASPLKSKGCRASKKSNAVFYRDYYETVPTTLPK